MDFTSYTPSTITSVEDFKAELTNVIEKGFAIDVSEQLEGCHCIGVPLFNENGRVIASLWATGPSSQLPVRDFERITNTLRDGAQQLSMRLKGKYRNPNRAFIKSAVQQACEIIEQNLNQPMDMKELAANLYVSYSWFRKVFKEQTGLAPSEYHLNLRIKKAEELICDTNQTVRQISEELGFNNQNHFSALFKRKTGTSPLNYRKKHKNE
jgi:AraC-like DNA-binding protein